MIFFNGPHRIKIRPKYNGLSGFTQRSPWITIYSCRERQIDHLASHLIHSRNGRVRVQSLHHYSLLLQTTFQTAIIFAFSRVQFIKSCFRELKSTGMGQALQLRLLLCSNSIRPTSNSLTVVDLRNFFYLLSKLLISPWRNECRCWNYQARSLQFGLDWHSAPPRRVFHSTCSQVSAFGRCWGSCCCCSASIFSYSATRFQICPQGGCWLVYSLHASVGLGKFFVFSPCLILFS